MKMSFDDATPYLTGNFAPVTEEITALDLPASGQIPEELEGRLLRNGPNPIDTPSKEHHHWFLGDGMVHRVRLRGGKPSGTAIVMSAVNEPLNCSTTPHQAGCSLKRAPTRM
jgi:carotenoid cleavage dioxygenase-like enzyme